MHRHALALVGALAFWIAGTDPCRADAETDALREEVRQLREKVDALASQQSALLGEEIDEYLDETLAWRGAQGMDGPWSRISVDARLTAVNQNTLGLDPANRSVVNGDVDLDLGFQVNEVLVLFLHMTANESTGIDTNGALPAQFGMGGGAIAAPTLSGVFDGIGVNGTVPTAPGSVRMYEAGVQYEFDAGELRIHVEIGALDPRRRFLQNRLADDENTQFINNLFDDSPSVAWLTDATGRTSYGIHAWTSFGDDKQYTVSVGWFNAPGEFFNNGQIYIQGRWRGEVSGREMNVTVLFWIQEFFQDATGDGDWGGAVSWDWWATDDIGVFARIAVNNGDVNPVKSDFSFGAVWRGPLGSDDRRNDDLGLAIGFISANDDVVLGIPEDLEVTLEIYYRFMLEDGKLQISPHLMFVFDPGGNVAPWQDDLLVILGVRFFVPF